MRENRAFCTIITSEYQPLVFALHDSLIEHGKRDELLYVLIAEKSDKTKRTILETEGIRYVFVDDICQSGYGKKIYDKYFQTNLNSFRWSIKPVLVNYLISVENLDKVLFLDSDLFFFNDFEFLFQMLDDSDVLLSPHWRSSNPNLDAKNFELQFTGGIFNGGFFGINRNATVAMEWWAMVGEFVCEINPSKGRFGVQTHLSLMPVLFEGIEVLRHRGCNVANWNQLECKRTLGANGEVLINDEYPVVFIHFTGSTINGIVKGEDKLLMPHLLKYNESLKRNAWPTDIIASAQERLRREAEKKTSVVNDSSLTRLKRKIGNWLR